MPWIRGHTHTHTHTHTSRIKYTRIQVHWLPYLFYSFLSSFPLLILLFKLYNFKYIWNNRTDLYQPWHKHVLGFKTKPLCGTCIQWSIYGRGPLGHCPPHPSTCVPVGLHIYLFFCYCYWYFLLFLLLLSLSLWLFLFILLLLLLLLSKLLLLLILLLISSLTLLL